MMTDALMFKQALLALREVSMRLSKRFNEYSTVFTNKADPDDEVAVRGCQKITEYLEGFARSLAICVCPHSHPPYFSQPPKARDSHDARKESKPPTLTTPNRDRLWRRCQWRR